MTDEPLFDLPAPPPLKRPRSRAGGAGPMKWTNYAPKQPVKCDDCQQYALEQWREGKGVPLARSARFKLTQGSTVVLVCAEHRHMRDEETPSQ